MLAVRSFADFNDDNDSHGEHDFGSIELNRRRYFWKIDYYDQWMQFASPDASDPTVTTRALSIMLAFRVLADGIACHDFTGIPLNETTSQSIKGAPPKKQRRLKVTLKRNSEIQIQNVGKKAIEIRSAVVVAITSDAVTSTTIIHSWRLA